MKKDRKHRTRHIEMLRVRLSTSTLDCPEWKKVVKESAAFCKTALSDSKKDTRKMLRVKAERATQGRHRFVITLVPTFVDA